MKRLWVLVFLLVAVVIAQVVVIISLTVGGRSVTVNKLPPSTVTFTLPSAAADSAGNFTLSLSLSTSRRPPASFQFDLAYTPADITGLTFTAGPASTAAGKNIQCSVVSPTVSRCIVSGGVALIGNGVAATVTGNANKSTAVTLQNIVPSSAQATPLAAAITPGGGAITVAVAVVSVVCTSPAYETPGLPAGQYNIESGETLPCTVNLNQAAPAGGFVAPVTAVPAGVTVPANVTVPAGALSAGFNVVGQ